MSNGAAKFYFFRLRFHFTALGLLYFPPNKPGNILRGAFGTIFRRIACLPQCESARACPLQGACPYARTFEPASLGESPSGLADWPRPFVFRANHLGGQTITPGQTFYFDIHLFQLRNPAISQFMQTFAQVGNEGLGPGRGRAILTRVDQLNTDGSHRPLNMTEPIEPSHIELAPLETRVRRARVRFVAPTELKHDQRIATEPEFGILMGRIRDRLSTLSALYGYGPLPLDFMEFGQRASQVVLKSCELEKVDVSRLSSRTGQRHSLGGFVGTAEYEGYLSEFIPFLEAAQYTGVGRQTTWGKGEIEIQVDRKAVIGSTLVARHDGT